MSLNRQLGFANISQIYSTIGHFCRILVNKPVHSSSLATLHLLAQQVYCFDWTKLLKHFYRKIPLLHCSQVTLSKLYAAVCSFFVTFLWFVDVPVALTESHQPVVEQTLCIFSSFVLVTPRSNFELFFNLPSSKVVAISHLKQTKGCIPMKNWNMVAY